MAKRLPASLLTILLISAGLTVWFWNYYGSQRITRALEPYNWLHPARHQTLFDPKNQILYRGNYRLREIALTIDDGPHDIIGDEILDLLKREQIKATFFIVGRRARMRPDLLRRMVDEGHEIGNHSQNHQRLDMLKGRDMYREIIDCENVVKGITGRRMSLLRPPGMRYNGAVIQAARQNGHVVVSWSCAGKDFMDVSPSFIVDKVLNNVENGSIILMHDERPMTVTALARIIPALKREGYRFVTITEMLAHLPTAVTRDPRGRWEPRGKESP